ncbi:uncharacterized protein Nmag_1235 [Natrialba magadii ATCC 43099]|uniref:Copper resistance protein D domain-containing protein n=1 Tax=Natrialba magadii (strain ATCC 43099 / DSM 3394 / CCM 3739 / CIP 104546 / IAM 13178 / JCM 8861 / NBRC 102185 / NCIMB 2190 / MS3) TaxID=547559 RepID=D3SS91_NATMM|nr:hypothetical protein [Natrialba magadii]ADD04817.1 uncharacterized protein Nmag_1235 [Natrialba magadii ATCC 43099]ELY24484.1 hypothetical protein C500_18690 [Natrialba magadii ATCC 43099]
MMTTFDVVMIIHTVFAAVWTGGTLVIAGAVIPAARNESLNENAISLIVRRFWYVTVASVLLLLFTGGHLAGTLYTAETLQTTDRGHLVLSMVGLWFLLPIVLYFGSRPLMHISAEKSTVSAATAAQPWFIGASAISIALLIVAALL